jgi:hypothetical protein
VPAPSPAFRPNKKGRTLNNVDVQLKDYAGRDFGGQFEVLSVTIKGGKMLLDLQYSGTKSNKRLSFAGLSIDQSILEQFYELKLA